MRMREEAHTRCALDGAAQEVPTQRAAEISQPRKRVDAVLHEEMCPPHDAVPAVDVFAFHKKGVPRSVEEGTRCQVVLVGSVVLLSLGHRTQARLALLATRKEFAGRCSLCGVVLALEGHP